MISPYDASIDELKAIDDADRSGTASGAEIKATFAKFRRASRHKLLRSSPRKRGPKAAPQRVPKPKEWF